MSFPTPFSRGGCAAMVTSLLLNVLGLYSERGGKGKKREKNPLMPCKGVLCHLDWLNLEFLFFLGHLCKSF